MFLSFQSYIYFLFLNFTGQKLQCNDEKKKKGGVIEILVLFLILKRIFPKFVIKNVWCKLLINIYVARLERVIIMKFNYMKWFSASTEMIKWYLSFNLQMWWNILIDFIMLKHLYIPGISLVWSCYIIIFRKTIGFGLIILCFSSWH